MARKRSSPRQKHVPQRMCVVCRTTADKRALTRLVRLPDGVQVDPSGKMNGRGAYLCSNPDCWRQAAEGSVLAAALRTVLTEDDRLRIREGTPQ